MVQNKNIVLGVTGGIAAYKAAELVSRLKKLNANVDVIMTEAAAKFVTPLTFQSLSQNPVVVDMFAEPKRWEIEHISLAEKADVFVIAPATANIIGKIANGIADDMLSTTVMATKAPVIIAPAMNKNMYENPILQENIKKLKSLGYRFVNPSTGRLACGTYGVGRLAEIDDIIREILYVLNVKRDLDGKVVMVTAGPTQEFIDPVRYITNRSSGKMGYAIAEAARDRGAKVILITGPTHIQSPAGVETISVKSALDMYNAVLDNFEKADVIIKAAAVADYRPDRVSEQKIKKSGEYLELRLVKNPDILYELGKLKKENQILVGFAAESQDLINYAKEKLGKKNLDFIVANNITEEGSGFEVDTNTVKVIYKSGEVEELPNMLKLDLAHQILDRVINVMGKRP